MSRHCAARNFSMVNSVWRRESLAFIGGRHAPDFCTKKAL
jgi:hypothetical protein